MKKRLTTPASILIVLLSVCGAALAQDQSVAQLPTTRTAAAGDRLYIVVNPTGSPASRAITTDDLFTSRTGNKSVLAYAGLSAAVASIGAAPATVEIPAAVAVTSSLTVPSNITLLLSGTGMFNISGGQTLTIKGGLDAPINRQIFTGAGAVRFGANIEASYPQWFGAAMNGTTDDRAAAQKAIDAWTQPAYAQFAGGRVIITGPMAIGSTLNIFGGSIVFCGRGGFGSAGYSANGQQSDYIKWVGVAGSPMLLIHAMGARVEGLHFIGKSSAKPSAAIEISERGSYFADMTCIRDVWIGPMYGADDDTGIQFERGIHFSGSVDSDTNLLQRVFITNCVTGIDIASRNASVDHFDTIQTIGCATGLKTVAPQVMITNWICASNDIDLDMAAQGVHVELYNYVSEGSGRMAVGSSLAPYRLIVRGGGFQADGRGKFATADFNGKRAFIQFKGLAAIATYIDLHDFNLSYFPGRAPAIPIIQAWNTSDNTTPLGGTAVHVKVEACSGILSSTIDVGSDGYVNSERIVEYTPLIYGQVAPNLTRFIQNSGYGGEDHAYQDYRYDFLGKVNVYGGPLKVKALNGVTGGVIPTGTGRATYSYKVTALTYDGETQASAAFTCTNSGALDSTHYNTVQVFAVHGAYAYKFYGRTPGGEQLLGVVYAKDLSVGYPTFKDDGSVTPSGAPPNGNTTGNLQVDGGMVGRNKAGDPTASDLAPGTFMVFKNTRTGAVKLWYNDGGTMKSVTLN